MASSAAQPEIALELEKKKEIEKTEDENPEEPMDENDDEEDAGEGDYDDVEEDVVLQIGDTYSCKRQDGSFHDAEIVKTRMNKQAGREEFFVHYVGLNRRQNEWVEKTRLVIPKPEGLVANNTDPETAEDGKASLKRKNEDGASEAKRAKVTVETAPSSDSATAPGDFADELTCLLCSELFKDPVMVECGHNFCRNCIDQAWVGQESFTCPDCKEVITDKRYTTNRALANLVKKTVGNTAVLVKPTEKPKPTENCPEHDERLKLYCKDDGMLSCVICRESLKHVNHNFLPILDAVGLYKTELSGIVAPLEEAFKVTEQLTTKQSEKVEQHKSKVTESREHIMSEFEELRTFFKEREKKLLDRLQDDGENLMKEIETNMVNLQESHDNIEETIATANEKMNDTDSICFLTGIKSFIEKCEEEQKEVMEAGNALLSKDLCMGTFKGPIQYSIWKQMKSIIKPHLQNQVSKLPDQKKKPRRVFNCYNCGKPGHIRRNCRLPPRPKKDDTSQEQSEDQLPDASFADLQNQVSKLPDQNKKPRRVFNCYNCGKPNHLRRNCRFPPQARNNLINFHRKSVIQSRKLCPF